MQRFAGTADLIRCVLQRLDGAGGSEGERCVDMKHAAFSSDTHRSRVGLAVVLLACGTSVGTWFVSPPLAAIGSLLVGGVATLWRTWRPSDESESFRHYPERGPAGSSPAPTRERQTVFAKLLGDGELPPRLWPDERDVVAWCAEVYDGDGSWHGISSTAALRLEGIDGTRFVVHPGCDWRPVTAHHSYPESPPTPEDVERVREACVADLTTVLVPLDRSVEGTFGEDFDRLWRGDARRCCSVFVADQWVSLSGKFRPLKVPTGYRDEGMPTFVWDRGTIDDHSLDERWRRHLRRMDLWPAFAALAVAAFMLAIAASFG